VILECLNKAGYKKPTLLQQYAIPVILAGFDLVCRVREGSGKTVSYSKTYSTSKSNQVFVQAAFMIPVLDGMIRSGHSTNLERRDPFAIVVVPTRDMAFRVKRETVKLAKGNKNNKLDKTYFKLDFENVFRNHGQCGCLLW
jgi:superfamily II DNA/RNA helicase